MSKKFITNRKYLLIASALAFSSLALSVPALANAQNSWWGTLAAATGSFIGEIFYGLIAIVAAVASIFIAVLGLVIGILLRLNDNIVNTFVVQAGSSVTLALANLGFVLGIVIVALATIIRNQSYGIKQILWKLIVAAVLVNFSLVIAGAILGFASNLSSYFMSSFPGSGGGAMNFASNMASLFAPQKFALPTGAGTDVPAVAGDIQGMAAVAGGNLGQMLASIFSVVFAAVAMVLMIVTLAGFVLMLLARYVILSILLILMPLAWVAWVFPNISGNWSRWWSTFLRWTFFAPIVLFFMWLVISMGAATNGLATAQVADVDFGLFGFVKGLVQGLIQPFLNAGVLIGLTWGGLFAANSMSITGSKMAMGWAKSMQGAGQGYLKRRGAQFATAGLRSEKSRQKSIDMQKPNRNWFVRRTGRLREAIAVAGGEGNIEEKKKQYAKMTPEQRINALTTAEGSYGRQALIEQIVKDGNAKFIPETYISKDKEKEFASHDNLKVYKEARTRSGLEMKDIQLERKLLNKRLKLEKMEKNKKANPAEKAKLKSEIEVEAKEFGKELVPSPELLKIQSELKTGKYTGKDKDAAEAKEKELSKNLLAGSPGAEQTTQERLKDLKDKAKADAAANIRYDAEGIADFFQDPRKLAEKYKKEGKPLPEAYSAGNMRLMQDAYIHAMSISSPHITRPIIDALSKANILPRLEAAIEEMKNDKNNPEQFLENQYNMASNKEFMRYWRNNAGRNVIDLPKLMDLGTGTEKETRVGNLEKMKKKVQEKVDKGEMEHEEATQTLLRIDKNIDKIMKKEGKNGESNAYQDALASQEELDYWELE